LHTPRCHVSRFPDCSFQVCRLGGVTFHGSQIAVSRFADSEVSRFTAPRLQFPGLQTPRCYVSRFPDCSFEVCRLRGVTFHGSQIAVFRFADSEVSRFTIPRLQFPGLQTLRCHVSEFLHVQTLGFQGFHFLGLQNLSDPGSQCLGLRNIRFFWGSRVSGVSRFTFLGFQASTFRGSPDKRN